MQQYFECVKGKASKFWEIKLSCTTVTTRYGKVGAAGQLREKTFESEAAARKEYDRLVKEKTGKGYGEVADNPSLRRGALIREAFRFVNGDGVAKDFRAALQRLEPLIGAGDPEGLYHGGMICSWMDDKESETYLEQAARQGYEPALLEMGKRSFFNDDSSYHKMKSPVHYLGKIAKTNGEACRFLLLYHQRKGTKESCIPWASQGAGLGDAYCAAYMEELEQEERTFADCLAKAQAGELQGMADLGECYMTGQGTAVNMEKAFEVLKPAADKGYVTALNNLAIWHEIRKEKDQAAELMKKAVAAFEKSDKAHCAICYWNLGVFYSEGTGLACDAEKAWECYRKGAVLGEVCAMIDYARCCQYGSGCSKDICEAEAWFLKAAEKGSPDAMHHLAYLYKSGKGEAKSLYHFEKYLHWEAQSAAKGDFWALHGMDKHERAIKKYEFLEQEALLRGDAEAMEQLRDAYHMGGPVMPDAEKMKYWDRLYQERIQQIKAAEGEAALAEESRLLGLAEAGNAEEMVNLAWHYEDVDQPQKMVEWMGKACDLNHPRALAGMGMIYEEGLSGMLVDEAKAVAYYRKAIELGSPLGMLRLGLCHLYGNKAIPKDRELAVYWFNQSAMHRITEIYRNGKDEADHDMARYWLQFSAYDGKDRAIEKIRGLWTVDQVPADEALAREWEKKAAELKPMAKPSIKGVLTNISHKKYKTLLVSGKTSEQFKKMYKDIDWEGVFMDARDNRDIAEQFQVYKGDLIMDKPLVFPGFHVLIMGNLKAPWIHLANNEPFDEGGSFLVLGNVECDYFTHHWGKTTLVDGSLTARKMLVSGYEDSILGICGDLETEFLYDREGYVRVAGKVDVSYGIGYCTQLMEDNSEPKYMKPSHDEDASLAFMKIDPQVLAEEDESIDEMLFAAMVEKKCSQ